MLSYRHGFHAGNHADVVKHLCVLALLQRLCAKTKPFCYFETHAGAGRYKLDSSEALKTGEFLTGAGSLSSTTANAALLNDYLSTVRVQQEAGHYPGSPAWAQTTLREQDEMILCELHPIDYSALRRWAGRDERIHTHQRDGHEAVKALLPPDQKRGLVVIDPAYELKGEYQQCLNTIEHVRKHFRSACIALWYPRLPQRPDQKMLQTVINQADADILHITLDIAEPSGDFGMFGSGMLIIQPPWQTREILEPALQQAAAQLAQRPQLEISSLTL
ncbi:MAG: 23S rRNA (adenine(2030)-N(6))-methyltransferase RlmJ [Oceanococcus sp.]